MTLTKADLQDWHSNPVTKAVFKKIAKEVEDARTSSSMMETVDQTALRTAYKEGFIDGASALVEAYDDVSEEAD